MSPTLNVTDPLADRDVTIVVSLPASSRPQTERPLLVSIAVADEAPLLCSGNYDVLCEIIADAWTTYAAKVQLAATRQAASDEAVDETTVIAESTIPGSAEPEPAAETEQPAPTPRPRNLSLF